MKTILRELLPLLFVIPLVMLFFRVIPDRRVAATCAGCLFVGVPMWLMLSRWRGRAGALTGGSKLLWWFGVLQFWILFALPILGARLLFWEEPFEDFTFFGQSGADWHRYSSKSYLLMALLVLGAHLWTWVEARAAKSKKPAEAGFL